MLLPERDRQHRIQHRPESPRREALARAARPHDLHDHWHEQGERHHAARELEDVVSVHRHTISQAKALGHFLLDTFSKSELSLYTIMASDSGNGGLHDEVKTVTIRIFTSHDA